MESSLYVYAVVYDHNAYDLLIGRRSMHQLRISTQWGSYNWTIWTKHGIKPLEVTYDTQSRQLLPLNRGSRQILMNMTPRLP